MLVWEQSLSEWVKGVIKIVGPDWFKLMRKDRQRALPDVVFDRYPGWQQPVGTGIAEFRQLNWPTLSAAGLDVG